MAEDAEQVTGASEAATVAEPSSYTEALAGQGTDPTNNPAPEVNPGEEALPETVEPAFNPDEEHVIEFNGKQYSVKGSELVSILENQQKLAEKEKSLHKDYTQKTQALAAQRKSFEESFGRMPEPQELQALGKLWKSYFADQRVQNIVDAIVSGKPLEAVLNQPAANPSESQNPEVAELRTYIQSLEAKLEEFSSGIQQEKQTSAYNEGKRIFETWKQGKESQGSKISEEIIDAVLETAGILLKRNPTWDQQKALDEAYRRETIDQVENAQAKKVLQKADSAKRSSGIKITPKAAVKSDTSKSYSEILRESA